MPVLERIEDVETRLTELRRARAATILDGKAFTGEAEIVSLEQRATALQDARDERARRDREKAAAEFAERRTALIAEMAAAEAERLAHVAGAETATRALAKSLTDILATSQRMRALAGEIGASWATASLDDPAQSTRLSELLAAVLGTIPGHRHHFGKIEWGSSRHSPSIDWAPLEALQISSNLEKVKGHQNGDNSGR